MPITRPSSIEEMLSDTVTPSALRRNGQLSMIGLRVMFKGTRPRKDPKGSFHPRPLPAAEEGRFCLQPPPCRRQPGEASRVGGRSTGPRRSLPFQQPHLLCRDLVLDLVIDRLQPG